MVPDQEKSDCETNDRKNADKECIYKKKLEETRETREEKFQKAGMGEGQRAMLLYTATAHPCVVRIECRRQKWQLCQKTILGNPCNIIKSTGRSSWPVHMVRHCSDCPLTAHPIGKAVEAGVLHRRDRLSRPNQTTNVFPQRETVSRDIWGLLILGTCAMRIRRYGWWTLNAGTIWNVRWGGMMR